MFRLKPISHLTVVLRSSSLVPAYLPVVVGPLHVTEYFAKPPISCHRCGVMLTPLLPPSFLRCSPTSGQQVDAFGRDRESLRSELALSFQQGVNITSGFEGVQWSKTRPWPPQRHVREKPLYLGDRNFSMSNWNCPVKVSFNS
jgi:hypothetical protein